MLAVAENPSSQADMRAELGRCITQRPTCIPSPSLFRARPAAISLAGLQSSTIWLFSSVSWRWKRGNDFG